MNPPSEQQPGTSVGGSRGNRSSSTTTTSTGRVGQGEEAGAGGAGSRGVPGDWGGGGIVPWRRGAGAYEVQVAPTQFVSAFWGLVLVPSDSWMKLTLGGGLRKRLVRLFEAVVVRSVPAVKSYFQQPSGGLAHPAALYKVRRLTLAAYDGIVFGALVWLVNDARTTQSLYERPRYAAAADNERLADLDVLLGGGWLHKGKEYYSVRAKLREALPLQAEKTACKELGTVVEVLEGFSANNVEQCAYPGLFGSYLDLPKLMAAMVSFPSPLHLLRLVRQKLSPPQSSQL